MKQLIKRLMLLLVNGLARLYLWRFSPRVIAVTGSVGKTSTKEAIAAVLSHRMRVRRSRGNLNTEWGVPLSIIGEYDRMGSPAGLFWVWVLGVGLLGLLRPKALYPEVLILEYGADKPGDISALLGVAKPSIAVITAIGSVPVHVESYPLGVDQLAKEKMKLIGGLSVADVAILNIDDKHIAAAVSKTRGQVVSFGFSAKADIRISNVSHVVRDNQIKGITFKMDYGGASVPVVIRDVFSLSHAYAVACAMAIARQCSIHAIDAASALSQHYRPVTGRSVVVKGVKHTQIVDESYNSSPLALEFSLKTMEGIDFARTVGVLGDMLELGELTIKAHEKAGEQAAMALDVLVTVGSRAKLIAQRALKKGMNKDSVHSFDTAEEAGRFVQEIIEEGDLILVKGSHAIGLDVIVEELRDDQ